MFIVTSVRTFFEKESWTRGHEGCSIWNPEGAEWKILRTPPSHISFFPFRSPQDFKWNSPDLGGHLNAQTFPWFPITYLNYLIEISFSTGLLSKSQCLKFTTLDPALQSELQTSTECVTIQNTPNGNPTIVHMEVQQPCLYKVMDGIINITMKLNGTQSCEMLSSRVYNSACDPASMTYHTCKVISYVTGTIITCRMNHEFPNVTKIRLHCRYFPSIFNICLP